MRACWSVSGPASRSIFARTGVETFNTNTAAMLDAVQESFPSTWTPLSESSTKRLATLHKSIHISTLAHMCIPLPIREGIQMEWRSRGQEFGESIGGIQKSQFSPVRKLPSRLNIAKRMWPRPVFFWQQPYAGLGIHLYASRMLQNIRDSCYGWSTDTGHQYPSRTTGLCSWETWASLYGRQCDDSCAERNL